MKTLKSLFMLCAGLSFCACSSDNEPQFPEGTGAVEVKIVAPQTRAATEGDNQGTTVEVTGNIYVTVVHHGGTEEWTQKVAAGETSVKFYGVTNPTKVKVSMNGGDESYTFDELVGESTNVEYTIKDAFGENETTSSESFDLQAVKTVPVYGEAVPTLTGTIEQPANQPNGALKKYQMYTATVNLKIPVARLEVSINRETASTQYATLTATGAYLDNLYSNIGVEYADGAYPNIVPTVDPTNYYYAAAYYGNAFTAQGTGVSPLQAALGTDFVNAGSTEVVGFNIYGTPAANVPHFKFIFTNASAAQGQEAVPSVMYAKIISYVDGEGNPISLNNGEIYQIIDLAIEDSNIGMMEDNESDLEFGLTATVVKASWEIKEVKGTWADE